MSQSGRVSPSCPDRNQAHGRGELHSGAAPLASAGPPAPRSTSGLCFPGPPRPPMSSFHSCPLLPGEFRVSSDNSQVKDFPALNDLKKSTSKGGRARSSKCPTGLLEYEKHSCLQRFCLGEADVCELLGKHGSQGTWLCTLTHTSHIGVRTL